MEILCAKCNLNPAPITTYGAVWCDECNGKIELEMISKTDPHDTRSADWEVVNNGLKSKDPNERKQALGAKKKLESERSDGWSNSARSALLRETRNGNKDNATDIRDEIVKRKGKQSFGSNWTKASFFISK